MHRLKEHYCLFIVLIRSFSIHFFFAHRFPANAFCDIFLIFRLLLLAFPPNPPVGLPFSFFHGLLSLFGHLTYWFLHCPQWRGEKEIVVPRIQHNATGQEDSEQVDGVAGGTWWEMRSYGALGCSGSDCLPTQHPSHPLTWKGRRLFVLSTSHGHVSFLPMYVCVSVWPHTKIAGCANI